MKEKKHNLLMTGLTIRDEGCPKGAITFFIKKIYHARFLNDFKVNIDNLEIFSNSLKNKTYLSNDFFLNHYMWGVDTLDICLYKF